MRRLARLACLLAAAAVLPAEVTAQQTGTIQGSVTDPQTQRPLVGVQIHIVGTQRGTVSDARGRFLLTGVPVGEATVRIQLIGYETVDRQVNVTAATPTTLDVELNPRALALDELVVTGVGQATARRQLTTSVAVLGAQAIAEAPVQSVDQLLQGRVAGSTVSATSAQPGTGSLISFRGVSSVFGSQTPVIYVDGVRVDNSQSTAPGTGGEQSSALAELLTSDIDRIEVTRGGPASTLYGSDAATGVIQIFTKRGRPGGTRFNARIEQGVDVPELKYILDSGEIYPDLVEAGEAPTDFLKRNFFRNSHFQNYSLAMTGGTEAVTFHVSGRLQDSEGVQPKNSSQLFVTRGGVEAVLSERSRLGFSGAFTRSTFGRLYNGTAIADPLTAFEVGDALFLSTAESLDEAREIFLLPDIDETVDRFNFSTDYRLQASNLFAFRATIGIDRRSNEQTQFQPIGFRAGEETGQLLRFQRDFTSATLDAAVTLSWPTEGSVRSTFTVGGQGFRDNVYTINGTGRTFALPGSKDFGEAATITAGENRSQLFNGGFYFDENLAIADRLFLNAGLRIDAGTSFGDEVSFATYPKLGLSWDAASEPALNGIIGGGTINQLRLRTAYGQTGKFPPPFLRDRSFDATPFRGESAPRFDNPGNPDLKPEATSTIEVGFDAALFNDRLGVDFTWYDAKTRDALFFVPEQPVTGLGTQIRNIGEISNRGVELDVSLLLVNSPSLSWHVGATYFTVKNEVTSMGGAADFFVETQKHVTEGRPVGAWFVTTPIDTNGDGLPDDSERQYTGKSATPTRGGSFSTRVGIGRNLTVSALADWAGGHEVMDWGSVWATFNGIFRRELVEDGFEFPVRYSLAGEAIGPYGQSAARSAFIYSGDWWKLREISARYSLPDNFAGSLGAQSGAVFFSVRNLYIGSRNPLIDPELAGIVGGGLALGSESSITLSPPRSFRLGVDFNF